jgi:hypothetical protein
MPKTYEPISTQTLGTASASVTFSSIPQTYTDLILISNFKGSVAGENLVLQYNSDTATNYSRTYLYGNGSSVQAGRSANANVNYLGQSDSAQFMNNITNMFNYSKTTTFKTNLSRTNDTAGLYASVGLSAGLWRSTAAISSIVIFPASGNFAINSTFTLYGIKAA